MRSGPIAEQRFAPRKAPREHREAQANQDTRSNGPAEGTTVRLDGMLGKTRLSCETPAGFHAGSSLPCLGTEDVRAAVSARSRRTVTLPGSFEPSFWRVPVAPPDPAPV